MQDTPVSGVREHSVLCLLLELGKSPQERFEKPEHHGITSSHLVPKGLDPSGPAPPVCPVLGSLEPSINSRAIRSTKVKVSLSQWRRCRASRHRNPGPSLEVSAPSRRSRRPRQAYRINRWDTLYPKHAQAEHGALWGGVERGKVTANYTCPPERQYLSKLNSWLVQEKL